MPIGFPSDGSPQGGGTFTSGSVFYATVNQLKLDTTSNTLKTFIDTKQNTLTGSTTLLGIGSSITALNYNNITLNLPSTFPSDWSTLANKPTTFNPDLTNVYTKSQVDNISTLTNFYTKSSTDTLLSAKQPTLISTMTLAGIGSNLTLINYNTLSNLPNLALKENVLTFNSPLSRVGNTISLDLSTYLTSNSASNIFYTITNATTALATKEAILTFNSPFSRVGNTISLDLSTYLTSNSASNIFDTIAARNVALATKENVLTFSAPLTRTVNTISLDLSTYLTSNSASNIFDTIAARNTALGSYLPLAGGSMTGALTVNNNINITGSATNSLIFDNVTNNKKIQLNTTNGLGVATNGLIFYTSGGLAIKDSTLSTTLYSVDSGGSMSTNGVIYPNGGLSTIGNVSANTFTENGTLLSNKYQPKINTYTLSPAGTATFSAGTLTFDLSAYQTSASLATTYLKLDGTNSMTGTLTGTTINASANLQEGGINLITKYQSNLSATALTLTTPSQSYPPSYLSASTATINNTLYGAGQYIATSGSDYPGQAFFQCLGANPSVFPGVAQWTSGGGFNTTGTYTGAARTTIGGVSTAGEFGSIQFPYPVIMTSYTLTAAQTPYHNYMMRDWVLCGSTDGTNFTQLDSRTAITWTSLQTITYTFTNTTPYLYYRIVIKKTSNINGDPNYTGIVCDGFILSGYEIKNGASIKNIGIGTTTLANVALNVLGTTSHIGVSLFNGTVGIGTETPRVALDVQDKIYIGGSVNATAPATGLYGGTGDRLILWAGGTGAYPYSLGIAGSTLWYSVPTSSVHSFYAGGTEYLKISNTAVNVNTSLTIGNQQIYNYLFNNLGANHGDITNFNSVSTFGYKFIQGNTNGPSVPSSISQSYSWYIGLGINYDQSQYGAQFAIPRNTTNPTLSVRFKEGSSWGGWSAITAGYLRGNATFTTDVWNYSSEGNQRIYFANNNITYFQGYNGGGVPQANCFIFRNSAGTDIIGINNNGNTYFVGQLSAQFYTISGSYRDLLGCQVEGTAVGASGNYTAYIIQGTFTGIHRVFTEDPLFIKEEPQQFKDDYEGRIVIANGKIATDTNEDKDVWEIKYDKDGITIEDALPIIELSRKKKDKRVFGVLGAAKRNVNRPERLIINSLGEGAIWVCNSNGNLENGDFIQSSDYLGYGERQDDDLFHNYTVGKITIDCDFILDSPYYQCKEIDDLDENGNKLRVAFVSCVYHCG